MSSFTNQYIQEVKSELTKLGLVTKDSWKYQEYTLRHKIAFINTFMVLRGCLTDAAIKHDTDKLVLYGVMNKTEASKLHRELAKHHIPNCDTDEQYINCIVDYECARFTKPDKPLNAYSTIMRYCPDMYNTLNKYLKQLDIDSPDTQEFCKILIREGAKEFQIGEIVHSKIYDMLSTSTLDNIKLLYGMYMRDGARQAIKKWNSGINWETVL